MRRTSMLVSVAALALATPAMAQSGPSGMFGATSAPTDGRNLLTLQMGISEAVDSDVAPEFRERLPGGQLPGRRTSVIAAGLDYTRNRRAVQLSAATAGFFRYSHDVRRMKPGASSAQVGIGLRLPDRIGTLSLSQGLSYAPSYLYQLMADDVAEPDSGVEAPPDDPEYRIDTRESLAHRTRLRLKSGAGVGWQAETTLQHLRTDFRTDVARGARRTWDGGTRVSYHPTRRGSISFGYRYRDSSYRTGEVSQIQELSIGADFTPPLTPRRRLTVRVLVAPTLTNTFGVTTIPADGDNYANEDPGGPSIVIERRRRVAVQGEVGVSYPISLRWHLSTAYQRRIQTLAVLSEPVATHGARLRVAGVVGRRVDVAFQVRHTQGASAAGIRGNRLTTSQGEARVRFALSRSVAVSGEYLYYRYDFGGRLLGPEVPQFIDRHGVRIGISMFTQVGR
jgi:hypothetical protein